ncbi:MAG TPA: DUF397 domain-containing protein [Actinocrinis sp.]|nr:DUF397 domain-containing protein [Actinocrinis sp.]
MNQPADLSRLTWRKSSRSNTSGGNCVEIAELVDGGRAVRDSKDPNGPALMFTAAEWAAFIGGVKDGEFDQG